MTEFINAAKIGNIPLLVEFLSNGTDINYQEEKDGATALYWAACAGHHHVCYYLTDEGADVTIPVKWGAIPLHAAADRGTLECVRLLCSTRYAHTINARNNQGDTPLHRAAYRGYIEICKYLLSRGANLDIINNNGKTPSAEAEGQDKHRVIQLFQQHNQGITSGPHDNGIVTEGMKLDSHHIVPSSRAQPQQITEPLKNYGSPPFVDHSKQSLSPPSPIFGRLSPEGSPGISMDRKFESKGYAEQVEFNFEKQNNSVPHKDRSENEVKEMNDCSNGGVNVAQRNNGNSIMDKSQTTMSDEKRQIQSLFAQNAFLENYIDKIQIELTKKCDTIGGLENDRHVLQLMVNDYKRQLNKYQTKNEHYKTIIFQKDNEMKQLEKELDIERARSRQLAKQFYDFKLKEEGGEKMKDNMSSTQKPSIPMEDIQRFTNEPRRQNQTTGTQNLNRRRPPAQMLIPHGGAQGLSEIDYTNQFQFGAYRDTFLSTANAPNRHSSPTETSLGQISDNVQSERSYSVEDMHMSHSNSDVQGAYRDGL